MSSTCSSKVDALIKWLNCNSYWRDDLIIKQSKFGGIGVFNNDKFNFEQEDDKLLLRIPKTNLLNPKNSFIYNLLVEYDFDPTANPEILLSEGMYGLVLTLIYEESIRENSPWFEYLNSIDIQNSTIPICLWNDSDKNLMKNTEVDLLNMLSDKELISFFIECIKFARLNEKYINIPSVLDVEKTHLSPAKILNNHHSKLIQFGKYIQSVVSRAFQIDNYYQLSLVPGADLFNHLQPTFNKDQVEGRENIHFVCDGSVCDECGEQECDHEEDEDSEDDDLSNEASGHNIDELTMDHIKQIELETFSEDETDLDPEEVSTLSMDEEEVEAEQNQPIDIDLANDLTDSFKCCDVILIRPSLAKYDYEIFNSYGNELTNAYLLQKYGFINSKENFNDSCLLSVEFFKQIKVLKQTLNELKRKELQEKLDWLEDIGYELISDIVKNLTHRHHNHEDDEQCCIEEYESWPLSIRIKFNGEPTLQTYSILKLVELKYSIFKHKLSSNKRNKKLVKNIQQILLNHSENDLASMNKTLSKWCKDKLSKYASVSEIKNSEYGDLILNLVSQEQSILNHFIDSCK